VECVLQPGEDKVGDHDGRPRQADLLGRRFVQFRDEQSHVEDEAVLVEGCVDLVDGQKLGFGQVALGAAAVGGVVGEEELPGQ